MNHFIQTETPVGLVDPSVNWFRDIYQFLNDGGIAPCLSAPLCEDVLPAITRAMPT